MFGSLRRLPWHRRAREAEKERHRTRLRLYQIQQDWTPLADSLGRIDHEIRVNDWTRTARDIFRGTR